MAEPSECATIQYAQTSSKLTGRMEILNYDTHNQHWYAWVRAHIPLKGDILEIGAGTGALWKDFNNANIRLTLTDFSSAMCEKLLQVPDATVKQCDAASLPFQDASFDVAIANHMLYHVNDPNQALYELRRVLRPSGTLIVTLNGRDHIQEILSIGEKIGRISDILRHARITAEPAEELISQHFTFVSSERCPGCFAVPESEPVIHYLDSWGDQPLNDESAAKVRALIEPHIAADGQFTITKHMVLFEAKGAA